ncbi:amidohydrolase family protein [Ruicaihuangia caeni]|uniref:Amidohydrolase family protein n=1 Tax=Ruicaihuangia caeni TaxID=3042517 RepID=A0AAW6TB48_9MICO|nr:amidohydrolase family protein [Klugiella sp. YN-L-19]MDI2099203.1 amidohydrolase family protein [Klugiella sp. YN-L-19]
MTRIDFRTYPVQVQEFFDLEPGLREPVVDVFGFYCSTQPLATYLAQLDEAGLDSAVMVALDCTTAHKSSVATNEQLADLMKLSERIIGFASVDPSDAGAPQKLRTAVDDLGLSGLNLDPALQQFEPADEGTAFPVFEAAQDLGIPVSIAVGHNWAPIAPTSAFTPMSLEPAISAFPELDFVIPHVGWPYVQEALALAIKYPNVHLDTSVLYGGRPESSLRRVLADQVGLDVCEASLREKLVFASDYPRVDPKRFVRAMQMLEFRPVTEQQILGGNAERLLGKKAAKNVSTTESKKGSL